MEPHMSSPSNLMTHSPAGNCSCVRKHKVQTKVRSFTSLQMVHTHTRNSFTHTTLSHTTLSHTALSHTTLSHTHTHKTVLFTHNFTVSHATRLHTTLSDTHTHRCTTLSHTALSHTQLSHSGAAFFYVSGVAFGEISVTFVWQVWRLVTPTLLCHLSRFQAQLYHTPLSDLSHTTRSNTTLSHTHNSFTRNFVTYTTFTHISFTYNSLNNRSSTAL